MTIRHKKRVLRDDSPDSGLAQPTDWNDEHEIAGLLGVLAPLAAAPSTFPAIDVDGSPFLAILSVPARTMLAAPTVDLIRASIGAAALDGPIFTGIPRAPTAALGTNTDQIATMAALKAMRDDLVNAAPGALDTLKELADAVGDNPNFAADIAAALGNRLRFDAVQLLSSLQKAQAVSNLGLVAVAVSGAYADLSGKPALGTAAALDVGASANKVVQLDGLAKLPGVDGSALTGIIAAWANITGKPTLGTAAALDVGTSANKVVQLDGSGKLPAIDGSALTNLAPGSTGNFKVGPVASGVANSIELRVGGSLPTYTRLVYGTDGTGYKFAVGKNQGGTITDMLTFQDSGLATFAFGVTVQGTLTANNGIAVSGAVTVAGNVNVARNAAVYLDGAGSNTYLTYNGTSIALIKAGVTVATW